MTPSSFDAEFLPGLRSCIEALNQPHNQYNRIPKGRERSERQIEFLETTRTRCFATSCFAWFLSHSNHQDRFQCFAYLEW